MCIALKDPTKNFGLPSVGRLSQYSEPTHLHGVSAALMVDDVTEDSCIACFDPTLSTVMGTQTLHRM